MPSGAEHGSGDQTPEFVLIVMQKKESHSGERLSFYVLTIFFAPHFGQVSSILPTFRGTRQ